MYSAFKKSKDMKVTNDMIIPKKYQTDTNLPVGNHMVKLLMVQNSPSVMKPVGEDCDEDIMDF